MIWSKNRMGTFKIAADTLAEEPAVVRAVLSKTIVVRCELLYVTNEFEYAAICPDFDELGPNEKVPAYEVYYDPDTQAVTWERIV